MEHLAQVAIVVCILAVWGAGLVGMEKIFLIRDRRASVRSLQTAASDDRSLHE